jgi:hypothetical protein
MSIHVIYVNSCHLCQFMSFMSIHVIYVNSCHWTFPEIQLSGGGWEGGSGGSNMSSQAFGDSFAVRPKITILGKSSLLSK